MSFPSTRTDVPGESRNPKNGVLVPSIAAIAAIAILVGLGMWQLQRKAWKEGLLAALAERLAAPPIELPAPREWTQLGPDDEFRRVKLTATFENDKEGLVFTSGSSLRADGGGPGYWVFTPARLADGKAVMVDRGFVPDGRQDAATRSMGQIAGPAMLVGALRFPETPGLFTPAPDQAHNMWFSRDSGAIAAAKGIEAAPFYVELEGPEPPGGLPHPAKLMPVLPNSHLQYAVTWFGLALMFAGGYVAWLFGSWRRQGVHA